MSNIWTYYESKMRSCSQMMNLRCTIASDGIEFPTYINHENKENKPFNKIGKCYYCSETSSDNMEIIPSIMICKYCFFRVIDSILKPKNLNKKIIEAIKNIK
jgi:hypothetical protein